MSMLVSTTFSMRNALIGLIVATALAISLSGTTIFGIDAWKIALAAAGAVLFVAGSDRRVKGRR
jgi:membrane-bound ClpP family serine protease